MPHSVFVFGTLKQGFPNFRLNGGNRIPGCFYTVERHLLYLVGERHSPWMIDSSGHGEYVVGEVYSVDELQLEAMDQLERIDETDGYRRTKIWVKRMDSCHREAAFAYLKPIKQLSSHHIQLGPLTEYTLEHTVLYRQRATVKPDR